MELDLANNRLESAAKRINDYAARPQPTPQLLGKLANLAERKLGQFDLAEKLYRQRAALSAAPQGKLMLALFLNRRDRRKEAMDVLEPLWANADDIDDVVVACTDVLLNGKDEPDPVQLNRGSGWLEQALKQKPGSILRLFSLASLREQRQGRYQEAEELYRSVIKLGEGSPLPGDLQRIAISYNNLAWLMALSDRKGREAILYVNQAIKLLGPLPDFLDTRGILYLTVGEIQPAIADLEKAVAPAPSPPKDFHLAQAYLAAKNKAKATQSWKAANKVKGWEQTRLLHPLEKEAYQKVLTELGAP
jgi:tetratricopeptide (TPR) repeat protein